MIDYSLYLVTDDPSRYARDWLDNVVAAVEGGVTCVQYRDTESAPAERFARVRALQDALGHRVPLIVNNDADLAAAVKAEGVHVGQSDLPPEKVRAIVGSRCEIGLSITHISQLASVDAVAHHVPVDAAARRVSPVDAVAHRVPPFVNALGVGPVFDARKTKADAADALGLSGLAEIVAACEGVRREMRDLMVGDPLATNLYPLPLVAIGGVTLANARAVLDAGADGLAVVSAFSKSSDPFATAQAFRKVMAEKGRA